MSGRDVLERVNLVELLASLAGLDAVRGLHRDRGGVVCDPRPGHEERHPSFSVYPRDGLLRWKRHGGDEAGGSAFDLLRHFGYSETQAWEELHRLAGVPLDGWTPGRARYIPAPPDPLRETRAALSNCAPLDNRERARVSGLLAPLLPGDAAALDLHARGLLDWRGLEAGKLRGDFTTPDGRRLARAGALAFLVWGSDGQPWGLKVRNLGTPDELRAASLDRYVYRIGRHGAPAWCSPDYGTGDSVLLVEGELNGAVAARALETAGMRVDVQGLAGAGGAPFLDGLAGRRVYVYADPDDAGMACRERVGKVAQAAGALGVWGLAPLRSGDFCDLCGELGAAAFADVLLARLESADLWQSRICGNPTLPQSFYALGAAQGDSWQSGSRDQKGGW